MKILEKKKFIKFFKKMDDTASILTKRNPKEKALFFAVGVLFAIYAIALIVPFIWLILMSFNNSETYLIDRKLYGAFFIPKEFHFENYINAFSKLTYDGTQNFLTMTLNSLWVVGLSCTYCMFWPVCTAYVIAKYKFKGRDFLYSVCIFCMTVPLGDTSGAYYKLVAAFGIYDKGPIFDLVTNVSGFGAGFSLIIYGIFKGISWEYAEAVFIDGGNDYTVFFRIMIPQAMPALLSLMVTHGITAWNEYLGILLYKPSNLTISAGMFYLSTLTGTNGLPMYYAGLIMCILPILIIYAFSVGGMMKNLTIGGLKG